MRERGKSLGADRVTNEPAPIDSPPRVSVRHLLTLGLWALAIAVAVFWFAPIKVLFLGVLAACAMASALHPLMKWLPGPRALRGVIVALLPPLLLAGIVYGGGKLLASKVSQQVEQWPEVRQSIDETLAGYGQRFGLQKPPTVGEIAGQVGKAVTGGGADGGGGGKLVATATGIIGDTLLALTFVFFGTLYLLVEPPRQYAEPIRVLLPPHRRPQLDAAMEELVPRLRWWLIGTMISMSVVATLSCLGYWLAGLRMALPLGLLTGFSEVVPTLGPASSFLVALLFGAAQGGGAVAGVIVVYAIVQTIESYVLTPLVMKKAVDMPPLVTLFTVVLWGQTFGAPGLLLAIPLNLVIWTLVDHMLIRPRRVAVVG
jgi:predicted PurR-regulated permease PerM